MPGRPNVLLVVTDQQRPDLFGAAGRLPIRTPAADRLAREGAMMSRAYAAVPLCTPSRASLISGQYPSRNRTWSNGVRAPEEMLSLPRLLTERAGYRTAIFGKSHLQPCVPPNIDLHTWKFTNEARFDIGLEAAPRAYDHEYFRSWKGPWYGFEHACISVGHTCHPNAYSMHYGLWLRDRGIPLAPPYFMSRAEAEAHLGHYAVPGQPNRSGKEPDPRPACWAMPEECHSSTWVANEVIGYLRDHAGAGSGRPFFVSANFPDPHNPLVVPSPWDQMYEDVELPAPVRRHGEWAGKPSLYRASIEGRLGQSGWHARYPPPGQSAILTPTDGRTEMEERWWRTYMGMQSLVDKHLGRILDELDRLGIADETLVIMTSDHGDYMGDHFLWGKGGSHYDAAVRVPLIVRWPGRVPAGATSTSLQSLVDVAPTIMSAAGVEPDLSMQGVDQLPSWVDPARRCREGLLIEHRVEAGLAVNSWITDRHRISIHNDLAHNRTELELYDLVEDPGEFESLAGDIGRRSVRDELLADAWRETVAIQAPWPERVSPA
jgi:arylsulfatase A-like enzyme